MSYATTCPNCGAQLAPVYDADPHTAPWSCTTCTRGWWPAELTTAARALWDPETRSHGRGPGADAVDQARDADLDAAIGRGTSTLPEFPPEKP